MTAPHLDPEMAHLADIDVGFGGGSIDLDGIRSALRELLEPPPSLAGVSAKRTTIGDEPGLSLEIFSPTDDGPHPCLIWFHGGGFVIGSAAMDAPRLQEWAARFQCVTVSVDYRLAPEDPFPAAHDDAVRALRWVGEQADAMGIDRRRIVVGGASAGGGIAAALALAARDRGIALAGQLLFYPMLDDRQETPSSRWDAAVWPPGANEFGWRAYLGELYGGPVPSYAAPSRTTELGGSPPTMLLVGGADGFFDEDVEYATRLTRDGVPTEIRVYAGAPHGFDLMAPGARSSLGALHDAEAWLEERFAIGSVP
jgi:acetyl esterase/lipase